MKIYYIKCFLLSQRDPVGIPTYLGYVLLQGFLNNDLPGQHPVREVGPGRHWVDGSNPRQVSHGSFAAAGSVLCSL